MARKGEKKQMSKDYGTESEIRQELDKLTTKEVIQKLKLWLNRPTEDIGIINTEQLMLERIEQELEVLEALKKHFYEEYQLPTGQHSLLFRINGTPEYKKIKEWLDNDK